MTSELEVALAFQLRAAKIGGWKREVRFHPKRKWSFDFCWPQEKLAVEVEGGQYVRGRHQRSGGMEADCEKYNAAALLGWTVLRFTTSMVTDLRALQCIERALGKEE